MLYAEHSAKKLITASVIEHNEGKIRSYCKYLHSFLVHIYMENICMQKRETHYNYLKSVHIFLNSVRKNAL